ncbi:MAG: ABC transporter permease [Chloroflexota bacterium]|nr:ABC transporter permease [Chloroflexota bacterium]
MRNGYVPLQWLGCALLSAPFIVAVFAPLLAPYDPHLPVGRPLAAPTIEHPLGTNDLGQDTLSQLIYGARASLSVAVAVAAISTVLSWSVGLAAGFFRPVEGPLMALSDLLLALPNLPLYMLVVTLVGPSRLNLILVLALLSWPAFARVVRSVVIQTRSAPYVEAAGALGATGARIAVRHLFPATLSLLPTKLILTVRFAVFAEATLAFLGLAEGGSVSWGTMLSHAFSDPLLFSRPVWPWLVLPPTLAIMALILVTTWISGQIEGLQRSGRRSSDSITATTVLSRRGG